MFINYSIFESVDNTRFKKKKRTEKVDFDWAWSDSALVDLKWVQKNMVAKVIELRISMWVEVKKIDGMDFVVLFERNMGRPNEKEGSDSGTQEKEKP